jgi:CheY-like chemotaxis protein
MLAGAMADDKPRILCADDDPEWRSLLTRWLQPHCDLLVCASGAETLGRAKDFRPDCAVLDYELGDQRGSEVCAALKKMPKLPAVPVVILTSRASSMFDAVKEGGPEHFVVKSPAPDELLAVLRRLLADKGFSAGWEA